METVQLTEELPEDPQEEEDDPTGKILRNVLIAGIAIVAVVIVLFLILSQNPAGQKREFQSAGRIFKQYRGKLYGTVNNGCHYDSGF